MDKVEEKNNIKGKKQQRSELKLLLIHPSDISTIKYYSFIVACLSESLVGSMLFMNKYIYIYIYIIYIYIMYEHIYNIYIYIYTCTIYIYIDIHT